MPGPSQRWSDAFGNQVANRTNVLDIASHYPYNPERWRLFVDGSRVFPEYGSVSQYNHAGDIHELKPAAGETVTFETAERPRYVVGYELAWTAAFLLNQSLQSGDSIKIGLYDGDNGWYMEQDGSHADDEADFVLERNNSEVYREEDVDIHLPTTTKGRLKLQTGWYDVTRNIWERSFPDGQNQANRQIGVFGSTDQGSEVGNLPAHFEVTASGSTSNLILNAGSTSLINLGDTTPLKRSKQHNFTVNLDATGSWVPLWAARTQPDKEIINTQLVDVAINEFGGSADVEVSIQAFDPTKVADSGGNQLEDSDFSTPALFSSQNNTIETTTNVEQVADQNGTLQTSMSDPGGFQIGHDTLTTATGNAITSNEGGAVVAKRPIYGRDIGVFLAKSSTTGDITMSIRYEQDW